MPKSRRFEPIEFPEGHKQILPPDTTARQKFRQLAEIRVAKTAEALELLETLGRSGRYPIQEKDAEDVRDWLQKRAHEIYRTWSVNGPVSPIQFGE